MPSIPVYDLEKNVLRKPTIDDLAEAVYALIQLLDIGEVTSYGDLAGVLGVSPRLIGRILGLNKEVIAIPCHRVVSSRGGLGGYSLGIEFKRKLLQLEGSLENGRVKPSTYRSLYSYLMDP